jgi:hypothetical protein
LVSVAFLGLEKALYRVCVVGSHRWRKWTMECGAVTLPKTHNRSKRKKNISAIRSAKCHRPMMIVSPAAAFDLVHERDQRELVPFKKPD